MGLAQSRGRCVRARRGFSALSLLPVEKEIGTRFA